MRIKGVLVTLTALSAALATGVGATAATARTTAVAGTSTAVSGTTSAVNGTTAAAAAYCGISWGSAAKSAGPLSQAPLIAVRPGRHQCFDRLVFEFNGKATGYRVEYGNSYTDGEGLALRPYTAGGMLINVSLRAPAYDAAHASTYPHRTGDHVVNALRYKTLRDVVYGGSFEGYTTFAVGVRARLPFRVFTVSGPGTHSRIVLDVAHQW